MFVEITPKVWARADCVFRVAVTQKAVTVMYNEGHGGGMQMSSASFKDEAEAESWARFVMSGIVSLLKQEEQGWVVPPKMTEDEVKAVIQADKQKLQAPASKKVVQL